MIRGIAGTVVNNRNFFPISDSNEKVLDLTTVESMKIITLLVFSVDLRRRLLFQVGLEFFAEVEFLGFVS